LAGNITALVAESIDNSSTPKGRRAGTLAIIALALAWAFLIQGLGWSQTANFALVRALSDGTAKIDRYAWESKDTAYYEGHYYSVKAPGLALSALPFYKGLDAAGAQSLSRDMATKAREGGGPRWHPPEPPKPDQYGGNPRRAEVIRARIENYTPLVWMLNLFTVVIPAMLLLFAVRWGADRLEPGMGTATAIMLGAGTMVMPFATLWFSHVPSALLGFACFALLWKERDRAPRPALLGVAGLLGGLAITFEYPLAIVVGICGLYAISRSFDLGNVVRRGSVYTAGVLAGVAPLAIYNLLAFGSLTHNSYEGAVKEQGRSGHDVLGLNDDGLFGIGVPSPVEAFNLLLSTKGLFVLAPVLVMGVVGTVLLYRRQHKAESLVIASIAAAFLIYNSGYWLPFGGGSPGPRFLVPVLPFLAVPIALALKRFPSTTLALAIPSIMMMGAATVAIPMIGNGDTGYWLDAFRHGGFEHTILTTLGADNGWLALAPFLLLFFGALAFAVAATPRLAFPRDATLAVAAAIAWGVITAIAPLEPDIADGGSPNSILPFAITGVALALIAVAVAVLTQRRQWTGRLAEAPETTG
jgi:hypothetical protein